MIVLAILIMLTQSRGVMLGMGGAALLLLVTSRRRGRDLVLLVLMMGGAAIVAPKDVWQRLAGLANFSVESGMQGVDPEGSAESRWLIWQIAWSSVKEKPLLGVGAGMMPTAHRWEALRRNITFTARGVRDTHSTYLRIAAEHGVPGFILYVAMWVALFAHLRRVRRTLRDSRPKEYQVLVFLELAMVAFMIASIFGTYGAIAFTYLSMSVIWLTATILEHEPWYVPRGGGQVSAPTPAIRRR
jgi:O-antigen ligase